MAGSFYHLVWFSGENLNDSLFSQEAHERKYTVKLWSVSKYMSEKEASPEESTEPTTESGEDVGTEAAAPSTPKTKDKTAEEKPSDKGKQKRKEKPKTRAKLTVLQAAVLETIRERPQRAQAIQTIIRGVGGVEIPRNEIIRSLNELKGKGLVEKVSAKAWQAK